MFQLSSIGWHVGKILQLVALLQAPYALYLGMTTGDARAEMKHLALAAIQFLVGYLLVSVFGNKQ